LGMSQVRIHRYQVEDEEAWNDFVANAKNATFLFNRQFMDYHSSRFVDHSLMLYHNDVLRAVMPANERGDALISHGGLSYGGMILDEKMNLADVVKSFFYALKYLYDNNLNSLTYKCVPSNFARLPSHEDQFAMFLLEGELIRRDMSAVNFKSAALPLGQTRRNIVKRNISRLQVTRTADPSRFWDILENNLRERHGTAPIHTLQEIQLLMKRFPERIQCFEVGENDILGGTLIFETDTSAHAQYIASNNEGKKVGALDVLFSQLISDTFSHKDNFSFGMSNERDPHKLNKGLSFWKESFGARTIAVDTYQIETANYSKLEDFS